MKGSLIFKILGNVLIVIILLASGYGFGFRQNLLLFGLRDDKGAAKFFCDHSPDCQLIDEKSEEFSNGDTFVRVITDLTGQRVGILIPQKLNPQTLMEILIKVRTAKTLGAREITAYLEANLSVTQVVSSVGPLSLSLESILGVAGVEKLVEKGKNPRHVVIETTIAPRENLTHSFVVDDNHESMSRDIGHVLGVPVYRSDTLSDKIVKGAQISFVKPVVIPKSETFFTALSQIKKMTNNGGAVTWVTPLPWARSDKADQKGVTVIGRLIADLIENAGTEAIVFARAHAPQSQGFFNIPSFNVLGLKTLSKYLKELGVEMIVSPDAGFQKDATWYANMLEVPIAVANKQRDPRTGETKFYGFSGPGPENKIVAIVDDETSTGGTLAEVAEYLKRAGTTKVIAVVTHLAGDGGKALKSPFIDQLVVTDSYPVTALSLAANSKLTVLPLGEELGKAIEGLVIKPEDKTIIEVCNRNLRLLTP